MCLFSTSARRHNILCSVEVHVWLSRGAILQLLKMQDAMRLRDASVDPLDALFITVRYTFWVAWRDEWLHSMSVLKVVSLRSPALQQLQGT